MKARIDDELIKDTLGNVALVRTVPRTVRIILEYRLIQQIDVCIIVEKIASPIRLEKHNGNGYDKESFDLSGIILPEEWILAAASTYGTSHLRSTPRGTPRSTENICQRLTGIRNTTA